jgi:O-antigen/teichoic acid export membrane protein
MIGRKSLLIVITHYIADVLGLVGFMVFAKLTGDYSRDAIGVVSFAMSFISLFGIITDLGFSTAHIKRVSEGKDLGSCIGTFATVKIVLTSLMVVFVLVGIFIWKTILNGGFTDATTESAIYIIILYTVLNNFTSIALHTFTGKGEIAKLQITKLFENIVKTPLLILVAIAGVSGVIVSGNFHSVAPVIEWPEFLLPFQRLIADHSIGAFAMTYVFGILAVFLVGIWLMRKDPIKKPSLPLAKNYLSFALPIAISSVISLVATNIDKVMLGYYWASANVGDYYMVQRIMGFVTVLYLSVGTILFPTISKKHAEKDMEGVKKTVHLAERYITMIYIPPLIIILLFASPIINVLLHEAWQPAVPVLITMVFFGLVRGMTAPYSTFLNGMGRPDITAKFGVTVCLSNIVLNYLIIPENGILSKLQIGSYIITINGSTGAAFATVLSFMITFIGFRLVAKRLTGIKILQTHTPRHIIAGLIMGLVLYYIAYETPFFPKIHWYTIFFFALLGLGIYLLVLYLLREFKKEDMKFFLDIIHPKKMFGYVKSELKGEDKKK